MQRTLFTYTHDLGRQKFADFIDFYDDFFCRSTFSLIQMADIFECSNNLIQISLISLMHFPSPTIWITSCLTKPLH